MPNFFCSALTLVQILLFFQTWTFCVYNNFWVNPEYLIFLGPSFFHSKHLLKIWCFPNMTLSSFSAYWAFRVYSYLSGFGMPHFFFGPSLFYTKKPLGNHILFLLQMAWKSPSWCWTLEWKWIHNTAPQRCLCPDDWIGKTRILCSISWRIVSYFETHFSNWNYHKVASIIACLQYKINYFSKGHSK